MNYKIKKTCDYINHEKKLASFRNLNFEKSIKILQRKSVITTVGDLVCRECYDSINKLSDLIKDIDKIDVNNNVKMDTDENERFSKLLAIERIQENMIIEMSGKFFIFIKLSNYLLE